MLRSAQRRADVETRERMAWAWYVAALTRTKRLPSLAKFLTPTTERPSMEQSRADHAALLAAAKDN